VSLDGIFVTSEWAQSTYQLMTYSLAINPERNGLMSEQEQETSSKKDEPKHRIPANPSPNFQGNDKSPISRQISKSLAYLGLRSKYEMSEKYNESSLPLDPTVNLTQAVLKTIRDSFPVVPDNVEEARAECVRQFVTRILLKRMAIQDVLLVEELVSLATRFKLNFSAKHPNDFVGDFEIIAAVEIELMNLYLQIKQENITESWVGSAYLVKRALYELKALLDQYPEKLLTI
jgi:hypothetical protein